MYLELVLDPRDKVLKQTDVGSVLLPFEETDNKHINT